VRKVWILWHCFYCLFVIHFKHGYSVNFLKALSSFQQISAMSGNEYCSTEFRSFGSNRYVHLSYSIYRLGLIQSNRYTTIHPYNGRHNCWLSVYRYHDRTCWTACHCGHPLLLSWSHQRCHGNEKFEVCSYHFHLQSWKCRKLRNISVRSIVPYQYVVYNFLKGKI